MAMSSRDGKKSHRSRTQLDAAPPGTTVVPQSWVSQVDPQSKPPVAQPCASAEPESAPVVQPSAQQVIPPAASGSSRICAALPPKLATQMGVDRVAEILAEARENCNEPKTKEALELMTGALRDDWGPETRKKRICPSVPFGILMRTLAGNYMCPFVMDKKREGLAKEAQKKMKNRLVDDPLPPNLTLEQFCTQICRETLLSFWNRELRTNSTSDRRKIMGALSAKPTKPMLSAFRTLLKGEVDARVTDPGAAKSAEAQILRLLVNQPLGDSTLEQLIDKVMARVLKR